MAHLSERQFYDRLIRACQLAREFRKKDLSIQIAIREAGLPLPMNTTDEGLAGMNPIYDAVRLDGKGVPTSYVEVYRAHTTLRQAWEFYQSLPE